MRYRRKPIADRFWAKVNKTEDCWIWTGAKHKFGYGRFTIEHRKTTTAHRMAWILTYGETDLHVLHKCDNPPCVRPDHLFVGTHTDNMRDCWNKGRNVSHLPENGWNSGIKHYGHKLNEADVLQIIADINSSQSELATQFGVHQSVISKIRTGKIWKHLKR